MEARQEVLRQFEGGDIQALVAIHCLDEGVDVPSVYLEGTITREEYAARKESYVQQKTSLRAEVARFEQDGASRFKPRFGG